MSALARSAASAYDRHAHGDHGHAQAAGAGIRGGAQGGTVPDLQAAHLHGGARTRTATQSAPQGILSFRHGGRRSTRTARTSATRGARVRPGARPRKGVASPRLLRPFSVFVTRWLY